MKRRRRMDKGVGSDYAAGYANALTDHAKALLDSPASAFLPGNVVSRAVAMTMAKVADVVAENGAEGLELEVVISWKAES